MNTTFLDKKDAVKLFIKQASEDRKNLWKPILILAIVNIVAGIAFGLVSSLIFGGSIIAEILLQLFGFFASIYSIKFLLNLIDTGESSVVETLKGFTGKQLLYALGAYVLMTLATFGGYILLIVPGIIISYMLMLTIFIGAEDAIKPVAALKESRRLTDDYKMKIFTTSLSVGIHFMVIPIVALFFMVLSQVLGGPIWLTGIFIAVAIVFGVYAQFAYATLLPRIYRDLQNIKGSETDEEVIEIEEVLEGNQENK